MKILLVTDYLPTIDNYKGPSSLCFYLLQNLVETHDVRVVTTNSNKVPDHLIKKAENRLGIKYEICLRSLWMKLIISKYTGFLFNFILGNKYKYYPARYKLGRKKIKDIDLYNPDLVLIYPYQLIRVVAQLSKYRPIVIGPDSQVLGVFRTLVDSYVYSKGIQYNYSERVSCRIKLEHDLVKNNCIVGLVGKEDSKVFNICTNSNKSFFFPHPHYGIKEKRICFDHPRLRVIITGGDDYATYTDIRKFCAVMKSEFDLRECFLFTFIGKSWNPIVRELYGVCDVEQKDWVDDYGEEIIKHDIQIVPISNGLGTKGKTLDAMANGLLCIGSRYAMENVACEDGKSCVIYKDATEIVEILRHINANREKFVQIAEQGRLNVRKYHSPELCSKILLKQYFSEKDNFDKDKYLGC